MSEFNYTARGIVWDLDGTLLDSFHLQQSVLTEVLKRRNLPIPAKEVFVANYHGRLRDSIKGICGLDDGDLLDEFYEDFIRSEERHYENPERLFFADALDLLKRCHKAGLKQIIISNRPHHSDTRLGSPRNLAKREPLVGYVEVVVCGDDNEYYKPDARMLDDAEKLLNLQRTDLLVIGDQFVDAELAHNLGSEAVLVSRDGTEIPHLGRLGSEWGNKVSIANSLNNINISLARRF